MVSDVTMRVLPARAPGPVGDEPIPAVQFGVRLAMVCRSSSSAVRYSISSLTRLSRTLR